MFDVFSSVIITVAFICFVIYRYITHKISLAELIGGSLIITALFAYSAIAYVIGFRDAEDFRFLMTFIGALCEIHAIKALKEQVSALKSKSELIDNNQN